MGIIKATKLVYDYLKYGEDGQEPEVNRAIDQVDLDVKEGQFIAVLGHNGSGKSTLAKQINALLVPTEGTLWVDQMDTSSEADVWKIRQKAGMVFQNPDNQIIGNMVEEDVGFGPENLGVPTEDIWKRVDESLQAVGMTAYRRQSPNKLSGGQKQRVAIARALAMEPEVLLFDEPTSALDPEMVKEVLDVIKGLTDTGITMAIVTHEMGFAREVADRICFLDGGNLVEDTSPEEFFTNPKSERAKQFLEKIL